MRKIEKAFRVVLSLVLMRSNLQNQTFFFFSGFFPLLVGAGQILGTNFSSVMNYLMNKKISLLCIDSPTPESCLKVVAEPGTGSFIRSSTHSFVGGSRLGTEWGEPIFFLT